MVVNASSGTFEGPKLKGTTKGPGGDWVTARADGSLSLDVRLLLETDDGALILMTYKGISPDGGKTIRSAPLFETGDERYAWLNNLQAVATGGTGRRRHRDLRGVPVALIRLMPSRRRFVALAVAGAALAAACSGGGTAAPRRRRQRARRSATTTAAATTTTATHDHRDRRDDHGGSGRGQLPRHRGREPGHRGAERGRRLAVLERPVELRTPTPPRWPTVGCS